MVTVRLVALLYLLEMLRVCRTTVGLLRHCRRWDRRRIVCRCGTAIVM